VDDDDPSQGISTNKQAIVTIDNSSPYSSVASLPFVSTNANFTVCWSGTNSGPAIVAYDIYVSINSGPWNLWLAETTNICANFQGQMGNSYGFYSVAHDGAGLVQQAPAIANTTTIVAPHLPPQFSPVSNQFVTVGQRLLITNFAQDPDLPITFSLGSGAPAGAFVHTNGVFAWAPTCAQASTTNLITIWATDSYSIPLSNSVSFVVVVGDCLQISVGSTVMQVGTTSSVPASLISTLGLTNVTFVVACPTNYFTNWVMTSSNSAIGTTLVQCLDSSNTMFNLAASGGQTVSGVPTLLGSLSFTAFPGSSTFVPLIVTNVVGIKADGTPVSNTFGKPGRVVLIGLQPLLEGSLDTNSSRILTIYGNPGSNYHLAFSTNLPATSWEPVGSIQMTNLQQITNADPTAPQIYYRAQ
jgi:hypothetical protein